MLGTRGTHWQSPGRGTGTLLLTKQGMEYQVPTQPHKRHPGGKLTLSACFSQAGVGGQSLAQLCGGIGTPLLDSAGWEHGVGDEHFAWPWLKHSGVGGDFFPLVFGWWKVNIARKVSAVRPSFSQSWGNRLSLPSVLVSHPGGRLLECSVHDVWEVIGNPGKPQPCGPSGLKVLRQSIFFLLPFKFFLCSFFIWCLDLFSCKREDLGVMRLFHLGCNWMYQLCSNVS